MIPHQCHRWCPLSELRPGHTGDASADHNISLLWLLFNISKHLRLVVMMTLVLLQWNILVILLLVNICSSVRMFWWRRDLFWRMVSRKRELFRLLEFGKSNHDYTQLRKYCLTFFCLNFLLNVKISDVNSWNNDLHWNEKEIQDKFLPEKNVFWNCATKQTILLQSNLISQSRCCYQTKSI